MERLTCEICGSTDLAKQDGFFVCQHCGCKYSTEEVKKMMVEGTVQIDRSNEVENRLANAINAYNAGNASDSFQMCTNILDIEPNNYKAIAYKALSDAWQSSIQNNKLYSCSNEIERALNIMREKYKSDSEYTENCRFILTEMQKIGKGINNLYVKYNASMKEYYNKLIKIANNAQTSGVGHAASGVAGGLLTGNLLLAATSISGGSQLSSMGNDSIAEARKIDAERVATYNKGCESTCIALNNTAINILNGLKEPQTVHPDFYRLMTGYAVSYKGYLTSDSVVKNYNSIVNLCAKYEKDAAKYMYDSSQERKKIYWEEHAEEKANLEAERDTLSSELNQLDETINTFQNEIDAIREQRDKVTPSAKKKDALKNQISELRIQISNLGIFKGKERKSLQSQIDEMYSEISALDGAIEAERNEQLKTHNARINEVKERMKPTQDKAAKVKKRINEINTELIKER